MIRQVIVVEGKSDIARVKQAVEADIIATGGFALRSAVIEDIRAAYKKRGIIILTDPDGPGERIRARLTSLFPEALHAFVPKEEASTADDVGIEDASPEAIKRAFAKVRLLHQNESGLFTMSDLWKAGLMGSENASRKRAALGASLGIGFGNGKQFLKRLNHFGVTKEEWESALEQLGENNERC